MPVEDSLARRLAGQSVEKAGLALDQTDINRVIAEASVGSKFYENERKKDAELTEKIERLLKKKEEIMKGVDIASVEAGADKTMAEVEASRDLSQTIVHIDCDAFYASVEVLDNPSLAAKAFGVSPGVLTTASYEARKYGVRSAMPSFIAKKLCPHLIIVPARFNRYSEMSKQVMDVLRTRDPNMATVSVDEAYLNITQYCEEHDISAQECVQELRDEVHEKTKLTVSAGIAPNKMLAKICSEKNKPNGQFMMSFDRQNIMDFMKELPIRKVPGIGKVSERLIQAFGIKKCGDIYEHRAVISLMDHWLGLRSLLAAYLGIASNEVHPYAREERKSVGSETTFNATSNVDFFLSKLEKCAEDLSADLERLGFAGRTITLKYKLDTFKLNTRAKSSPKHVTSKEDLLEIAKELLMKELPLKLRLLGIQASNLKDLRKAENEGIRKFLAKSPPAKKRKTSEGEFIVISEDEGDGPTPEDEDNIPSAAQKPNFFGSDDDDDNNEVPVSGPSRSHPRPHSHLGTPSVSQSSPAAPIPTKQRSASAAPVKPKKAAAPSKETLTCPICNRSLDTDNAGLNAHVDFCLSRGVILEASGEGASSRLTSGAVPSPKTGSKGKEKAKPNAKRKNPFSRT